ncbi:MAG: serine/threonine-protein kinase [Candidatus Obscuribacterales bacterium]|nr:serine/threonine-protein kinase [Candidatus Obscuribacterales bacterium]
MGKILKARLVRHMEFKEKQDIKLSQVCAECGFPSTQCRCGPTSPAQLQGPLANYVLSDVVHESERSSIYQGRHTETGQVFAVKTIKGQPVTDRTAQRKLQQEGKAVTSLTHPHISAVYDYGLSATNVPFIARDYVEGVSLAQLIDQEGSLDTQRFCDIFLQILDALSYAHENGVLHLSLKPENIIVTKQAGNRGDFVKVVDFAVSRMVPMDTKEDRERCARHDSRYLSPEQARGEAVGPATDFYALGCTMYEALCGHAPFDEGEQLEIMCKQISVTPPELKTVARHEPPEVLNRIIMRSLAKDPISRPVTLKEIERALHDAAQGKNPLVSDSKSRSVDTLPAAVPSRVTPRKATSTNYTLIAIFIGVIAAGVFAFWPKPPVTPPVPEWKVFLEQATKSAAVGNVREEETRLNMALSALDSVTSDDKDLALVLSRLGLLYYSQNRKHEAMPILIRALPLYESMQGPEGPDVDWIATDIAEMAQKTENWQLAIEMYKKLEPIRVKESGRASGKYANLLAGLGGAYMHTHNYVLAEKHLRAALAIQAKLPEKNFAAISRESLNLAYILDTQLNKKAESEILYKQAIDSAKHSVPADKIFQARTLEYYSNYLSRSGQASRAKALKQEARAIQGLPPEVSSASGAVAPRATASGTAIDRGLAAVSRAKVTVNKADKALDRINSLRERLRLHR